LTAGSIDSFRSPIMRDDVGPEFVDTFEYWVKSLDPLVIEMLTKSKYVKICFKHKFMKHVGGGNGGHSSCS